MFPPMLKILSLSIDDGGLDKYFLTNWLREGSRTEWFFHQTNGSDVNDRVSNDKYFFTSSSIMDSWLTLAAFSTF